MCCGDPTKHRHAHALATSGSTMHGEGSPDDLTPKHTKSAFELDTAAENEATALLRGLDVPRGHGEEQASPAGV